MKRIIRMSWQSGVVLLAVIGPIRGVIAQEQANMKITNPGNNVLAGVYVGPYYATIGSTQNVPVICDDFYDETYVNQQWTANVTTVASGDTTWLTQREGLNPAQQSADYAEAAFLAEKLMNPATTCPATQADCTGDIQFAIWSIFDSSQPFSLLRANDLSNDLSNATYWLNFASAAFNDRQISPSQYSNVLVYSPAQGGSSQEFIMVQTPEPGLASLLGVDLMTLVGVVFLVRRRLKRNAAAAA